MILLNSLLRKKKMKNHLFKMKKEERMTQTTLSRSSLPSCGSNVWRESKRNTFKMSSKDWENMKNLILKRAPDTDSYAIWSISDRYSEKKDLKTAMSDSQKKKWWVTWNSRMKTPRNTSRKLLSPSGWPSWGSSKEMLKRASNWYTKLTKVSDKRDIWPMASNTSRITTRQWRD